MIPILLATDRLADFHHQLQVLAKAPNGVAQRAAMRALADEIASTARTPREALEIVVAWTKATTDVPHEFASQPGSFEATLTVGPTRFVAVRVGATGGVFAYDARGRDVPTSLNCVDRYAPTIVANAASEALVAWESIQDAGVTFGWKLDALAISGLGIRVVGHASGMWNYNDSVRSWLRIDAKRIRTWSLPDTHVFLTSSADRMVVETIDHNSKLRRVGRHVAPQVILDVDAWAAEAIRAQNPNPVQAHFRKIFGTEPAMVSTHEALQDRKGHWRVRLDQVLFDVFEGKVVAVSNAP